MGKKLIIALFCVLCVSCNPSRKSINTTAKSSIQANTDAFLREYYDRICNERYTENAKRSINGKERIHIVIYDNTLPSDSNGKHPVAAELEINRDSNIEEDLIKNNSVYTTTIDSLIVEEHNSVAIDNDVVVEKKQTPKYELKWILLLGLITIIGSLIVKKKLRL